MIKGGASRRTSGRGALMMKPLSRLHHQRAPAGRPPARPALDHHRRAAGRVRRRPARAAGPVHGDGSGSVIRHFLVDDDLSPAEQAQVLALAAQLKASPYGVRSFAGPRCIAVMFDKPTLRTQSSFAAGIVELGGYPMMVDGRLAGIGRTRVGGRHRPGARSAGCGHRLAHLRPVGPGGDGGVLRGADGQRPDRQLPPLPDPGGSADDHGAVRSPVRSALRLRRRRREQHGATPICSGARPPGCTCASGLPRASSPIR